MSAVYQRTGEFSLARPVLGTQPLIEHACSNEIFLGYTVDVENTLWIPVLGRRALKYFTQADCDRALSLAEATVPEINEARTAATDRIELLEEKNMIHYKLLLDENATDIQRSARAIKKVLEPLTGISLPKMINEYPSNKKVTILSIPRRDYSQKANQPSTKKLKQFRRELEAVQPELVVLGPIMPVRLSYN